MSTMVTVQTPTQAETIGAASGLIFYTGEELAEMLRFRKGANGAFRAWRQKVGIVAVPGRPDTYDAKLVRARLDQAQGLNGPVNSLEPTQPRSLVEQRRTRRAQA